MNPHKLFLASLVTLLPLSALAQRPQADERKVQAACAEALRQNPGIYFYVCRNGFSQRVLRASRKSLDKPDGFHPDKPPIVKDVVIDRPDAELPAAVIERLVADCRAHNERAPKAPIAQLKPSASSKPRSEGTPKPPASPALPVVKLNPLDAEVTAPGERFSNHAQKLLSIVGGRYEMNGKPVAARASREETLKHAEFVLSLTQSKNADLRQAALLTCALHVLRDLQRSEAELQNPDLEGALMRRMRNVVDRSLREKSLDLQEEFARLARDGEGGLAANSLGGFGEALGALFFTDEFRHYQERQFRGLVIGTLSAAAREHMETLASEAPGQATRTAPFEVKVIYDANDRTYLQLANRTRKPLHHVLIGSRCVADPAAVKKAADMYRVQVWVTQAMEIFPEEAAATMPNLVDLWQQIQMLDFGAVVFIPEVPAAATIKVELCSNDRLAMSQDARVSVWSDELVAKDLRASNFDKVLAERLTPPQTTPAEVKPFVPPIVPRQPDPKPKNTAEARALARKRAERERIAVLSIDLAQGALARGDDHMAQVYLVQAINAAPDSSAGKKAKKMLEKQLEKQQKKK